MKITHTGPTDVRLSQLVRSNGDTPAIASQEAEKSYKPGEGAQVHLSADALRLQNVVALTARGDELRAEQVHRIRDEVVQGTFRVEPLEVARSIIRSEISRILGA